MMPLLALFFLLHTCSSLRTTLPTNFKPIPEELTTQHKTLLAQQVRNSILNYDSSTSTTTASASTSTLPTQTPPLTTLLLQQRSSLRQRRQHAAEPTVAVLSEETPPPSAEEIKRNIANINAAKGSLAKMVEEVGASISNAEAQFKVEKSKKLTQLHEQKIVQAAQEVSSDYEIITNMQHRIKARRIAINTCLKMIYGGSNTFYWHMRDLL